MEDKSISVILAVRNSEKYLGTCIQSVISQTYENWELIIVVNCSVDNSLAIAQKYQRIDPRIIVLKSNIGQLNYNLNLGLDVAKGTFIARIDADDINHQDRLETQLKLMRSYHVVGSAVQFVDINDNVLGLSSLPHKNDDIRKKIFYRSVLSHPTVMIRKDVLLSIGGYQGGQFCEDYDLWLRLMRDKSILFHNIQKPLVKYRLHSGQMSSDKISFAYVAGYLFREALISKSFQYMIGAFIYLFKYYFRAK